MRLIFALFLLALLAYAGYLGVRWVGGQYALLPSTEQPGVALLAMLVFLGVSLLSGAIRYGAREQAQRGWLEQRFRLYQLALGALQQEEVSPVLRVKIDNGLALLGSRAVLLAYRKLRAEIIERGLESPSVAEHIGKLTLAMRTDLSQSNFEMGQELKSVLPSR
jgi:hypothetical protein